MDSDIKNLLSTCRSYVNILNRFGFAKCDEKWKDIFFKLLRRYIDSIEKERELELTEEQIKNEKMFINQGLLKVKARLEPSMKSLCISLKLGSIEEVMKLDSEPSILFNRYVSVNGETEYIKTRRNLVYDGVVTDCVLSPIYV